MGDKQMSHQGSWQDCRSDKRGDVALLAKGGNLGEEQGGVTRAHCGVFYHFLLMSGLFMSLGVSPLRRLGRSSGRNQLHNSPGPRQNYYEFQDGKSRALNKHPYTSRHVPEVGPTEALVFPVSLAAEEPHG